MEDVTDDRPAAVKPGPVDDPFDPDFIRTVVTLLAPVEKYFRFRLSGLERVPKGPCLLVANHSAAAVVEAALLFRHWYLRFPDRPVRWLAHTALIDLFGEVVLRGGAVLAEPGAAHRALTGGDVVAVFPGGDVEGCRSFADRYRVNFAGRHGFVALARQASVPIVPIAICGAHAPYLMLPGSRALAETLGLGERFRMKAFPLSVGNAAAASLLLAPPLWPLFPAALAQSILPWPSRIEAIVLPPTNVSPVADDEAEAERIEGLVQGAMDRLSARRATPWG